MNSDDFCDFQEDKEDISTEECTDIPKIHKVDFRKSSLSYIRHGRVHMRLPNDNVRLIIDSDLEPGVLFVDYNFPATNLREKKESDDESSFYYDAEDISEDYKNTGGFHQEHFNQGCNENFIGHKIHSSERCLLSPDLKRWKLIQSSNKMQNETNFPEVRYALSVDNDLFKYLVKEIADKSSLSSGGHESDSVDIRVAIIILTIFFTSVLVYTSFHALI